MVQRVAVIGAGAAGLVALRHLTARPQLFSAVAFEQTTSVGGTWVYVDNVGVDDRGLPVHSSMYKNLKTNLPKEVMAFPDYPFPTHLPSFIKHQDVRQYFEDYTDHFKLRGHIKFETIVSRVHPVVQEGSSTKWEVTYSTVLDAAATTTEIFDAVMVCSGHYSTPLAPDLPGLSSFRGRTIHSHDYREPSIFSNQTVVCLGAGSSGKDIMFEAATEAKQVILSHSKKPITSPLPHNIIQKPAIKELKESSVLFENGETIEVDTIIECTGYRFVFPFLTPECKLDVKGERVTPLYKHLIHTEFPTLSLVGIPKVICPFPLFDCQVRFFLASLDGSMSLPTKEEMDEYTDEDYKWRLSQGMPHRYAHHMSDLQWGYNDELAKMAKFKPVPDVVRRMYIDVYEQRGKILATYKTLNYKLIDKDNYRLLTVGDQ